jgi:hypothetical protein
MHSRALAWKRSSVCRRPIAEAPWALFQHFSTLPLTGPVAGLVAGQFGYAAVYQLGSACAFVGAALYVDASNLNTSRSTRSRRDPAA